MYNIYQKNLKPAKKLVGCQIWAKCVKIGSKIRVFVVFFKFGLLVSLEIE